MTTLTKHIVALFLCLIIGGLAAQDNKENKEKEISKDSMSVSNQFVLKRLQKQKENIKAQEREYLKAEIENVNSRLDAKKISSEEAEYLKKEAAKKRAANIEDKLEIIEKKIALIYRNPKDEYTGDEDISFFGYAKNDDGKTEFDIYISSTGKKKTPKYDIRTKSALLFAIGFNNAIGDGRGLDDSPYKLGGSGFVELGLVWQTRLLKASNFARINYGLVFQWNKLDIKNDQYFVENGDLTTLETFPTDLRQAKFRTTNLVVPIHLEFGGSTKREYDDRIRYDTYKKFKIGFGGYGGVRLGSMQKLRFDDADGDRVKTKEKRNFNASNFVYGLSGYIGFSDISLYAKYDLNPLFKDQAFDQHNISLGLRWDWD